ncbi:amidohydrolase family protein [Furfurilactobacillus milii]|uniref:Amidohydrolase family protein n=1 Tax=Furfurilactobacillus milii TaxID=2888272 RepID=A0A6N9I0D4_9LACO|nr:amidohydrolase family protein [Furfurilactobacillus milii]MYV16451.1 amidohydrolase family protein [Furfurilactobacillus milii]
MKKIEGHLHLVRSVAGFNGKGRMTPLGNGKTIWDDGTLIKLIPDGWGDDDFLAESALKVMDDNKIEKAVLLQGSLNGYQNYYSYQTVKKYPNRFVAAFSVDPFTDSAMKIVRRHVEDLGFRAIKFEISQGGGLHGYHKPFRLDSDPNIGRIFHYLADYPGFVVTTDYGDYSQFSYEPEAIVNLALRYPKLDFVVCHLSFPNADHLDRLSNALNQWKPLDNIYTDISAIQDIEGETDFPFPRCQKDVSLAKKILGSKRIIWGTDSPWSSTFNSYHNLATWLEHTDIFTPDELENVMYNNANRIYFKSQNVKAMLDADDPVME